MRITHKAGSYEVHFSTLEEAFAAVEPNALFLTDENLNTQYKNFLQHFPTLVFPAGEQTKNLNAFAEALSWLGKQKASRNSHLVLFGGGVVGDLGGFVASAYMRGIRYTQIPTSLLAQVDSSVGGKVGVDLPEGKNLAGAFYPPQKVVVINEVLSTLTKREFVAGTAEIHKYAFIKEPYLLQQPLLKDSPNLAAVVKRCIEIKAAIVQEDEYETKGIRATLNFGHTVGHALEAFTEYKTFVHGEAISIGMVVESHLGEALGITTPGTTNVVREKLLAQGLPVTCKQLKKADALIEIMRTDKKAKNGDLGFSLLTRLGECKLVEGVSTEKIRASLLEL